MSLINVFFISSLFYIINRLSSGYWLVNIVVLSSVVYNYDIAVDINI